MSLHESVIVAMEAVPTPLAALHSIRDTGGEIVDFEWDYINAAGARELLVERDEFIGQRLLVKLPEHQNGLFALYRAVVETGEPLEIHEAGYDDTWGTQEVIPRVYNIRAVKFGDGFIVYWHDVTDRIHSRHELERQANSGALLALAIDRSPIGMAKVALDGTFTTVNPAFCQITQRSEVDLVGKTFAEITHPDDLDADLAQVERLVAREIDSYVMDKRYVRPDGSVVWIRLHGSSVWNDDGDLVTFIAQISDIDEEKKLIARLERSNHDLEHFAYVASHDLRAPLRQASTFVELLTDELDQSNLTDDQREYLDQISRSLAKTHALVADLLDFSRAASADIVMVPTSLKSVVETAVSQLSLEIEPAGGRVQVDVEPALACLGSESLLTRVVTNLVSNSVRYRAPDRSLLIEINAVRRGTKVVLFVRDNGTGIPPELHERAFTMFQRLQTDQEGTGLGLALVRSIVERHNGDVTIDSDGISGTTVIVTLPAAGVAQ